MGIPVERVWLNVQIPIGDLLGGEGAFMLGGGGVVWVWLTGGWMVQNT